VPPALHSHYTGLWFPFTQRTDSVRVSGSRNERERQLMRKALVLVVAAFVIPTSVALAARPAHHGHGHGYGRRGRHEVTYVLDGTLSSYTAYDSTTPANGSITITVKWAGPHARSLKGATLTFPVDANTKISLLHGATAITDGDRGIITVRAARRIAAADLVATLEASSARHIVDFGAPKQ
jgi:hypothetical protein